MSKDTSNWLYCGSCVAIILVIVLIVQCRKVTPIDKPQMVLVDTPKGLVKIDKKIVMQELKDLRKKIATNKAGASQSKACPDLTPLINSAMENLVYFIKDNPIN